MSEKSKTAICAICEAEVDQKYRPFCSKRCADVDLHRWLNGAYAIPSEEDENVYEADPEAPRGSLLH